MRILIRKGYGNRLPPSACYLFRPISVISRKIQENIVLYNFTFRQLNFVKFAVYRSDNFVSNMDAFKLVLNNKNGMKFLDYIEEELKSVT
jgi:hypothetical protein